MKALHWVQVLVQLLEPHRNSLLSGQPGTNAATKGRTAKMLTTCGFRVNTKVYSEGRTRTQTNRPLLLAQALEGIERSLHW